MSVTLLKAQLVYRVVLKPVEVEIHFLVAKSQDLRQLLDNHLGTSDSEMPI